MKTGKSAKTTLVYVVALSLLLGTTVFLQLQASAQIVKADVEIDPDKVDLGAEIPGNFEFFLTFSGKYKNYMVTDIDRETVLVEGIISPKPGRGNWKIDEKTNTVRFRVNGEDLVNFVIWPKIYHMARVDPNPDKGTQFPYKIDITVTGNFYDGTPFSGADTIHVYVPRTNPPPPPPPP